MAVYLITPLARNCDQLRKPLRGESPSQAIIDLQKSVAEMNTTMRAMKESLDGVKSKVDDLIGWKHKIIGGAAVLVVVGGVIGWVIGKASEYVSVRVPAGVPVVVAPAPPTAAPAAQAPQR